MQHQCRCQKSGSNGNILLKYTFKIVMNSYFLQIMALPHLPAETLSHNGIDFSIELGFRNIQNLGNKTLTLVTHIILWLFFF